MNVQLRSLMLRVGKQALHTAIVVCLAILPGIAFGQEPGSNPDVPTETPGVPFDSNMNIILLLVGVLLAVIRIRQIRRKRKKLIMQ